MDLNAWLESTAWDKSYWSTVRAKATALKSDGCTGVADYLVWTCLEHDCHYRAHKMLDGTDIDKATADYIFRVRIQQGSPLGSLSPVSWIRWLGVSWLPAAQKAWNK